MDALKNLSLAGDIRRIEIDARVGGQFFFSDLRDGEEARHWGKYLELDRPRKIVFTWIVDLGKPWASAQRLTCRRDSLIAGGLGWPCKRPNKVQGDWAYDLKSHRAALRRRRIKRV